MSEIQIIDNFLTKCELAEAREIIENTEWVYANHSGSAQDLDPDRTKDTIFWYAFLKEHHVFHTKIFNKIKDTFKKNFKLLAIHTNGQTYGLDGDFHQDDQDDRPYTCLIYFSDITHKNINEVGGHTLVKTQNGTVCIEPFLNRLVIFKSNMYHKGLAPSKESKLLRISVAFKFIEC